jgi:predicted DNA-binding protein
MARSSRGRDAAAKGGRSGVPYTLYLSEDMTAALNAISSQRKVDKSDIVRTAIQRLLDDITNGQLDLPLGI